MNSMSILKIKDGFIGEKQINVPNNILLKHIKNNKFLNSLYITHIGYFPKAKFHYRERQQGCPDNILIYCVGGKGYYRTETESYTLKAHQFMILPPGRFHMFEADINNPWSIYWVHFSGQMLLELNKLMQTKEYVKPT